MVNRPPPLTRARKFSGPFPFSVPPGKCRDVLGAAWRRVCPKRPIYGLAHGEGFDHPPLDTLVLAMPVSWKGTLQHYAGRLHREHASKTDLRIIDFADTGHSALLRMWDKRQRGYRSMGPCVKAQRKFGEISEICSETTACP